MQPDKYKYKKMNKYFLIFKQMSMTARPTRVKMAEHVLMESTALPVRVFWVTLGTTVRQVRLTYQTVNANGQ